MMHFSDNPSSLPKSSCFLERSSFP